MERGYLKGHVKSITQLQLLKVVVEEIVFFVCLGIYSYMLLFQYICEFIL